MKIKIGVYGLIVFCILTLLTSFSFAQDALVEKLTKDAEASNEARLSVPLLVTYAEHLGIGPMSGEDVKILQAAKILAEVLKKEVSVRMEEGNIKNERVSYLDSVIGLLNTNIDCSSGKHQGKSGNTCYDAIMELDQKMKSYNNMFKDFEIIKTYNVKKNE